MTVINYEARADWSVKECLEQSFKQPDAQAEQLVKQIAESIGLVGVKIVVLSCEYAEKAYSYVSDGNEEGAFAGKYIVYNPDWLREVIGKDQVQAAALFGHELGHILNDHFGARKDLSSQQKETEADHFAGCAVARLRGQWSGVEDLFARLRKEKDQLYPDRLSSLETAKEGFDKCGGANTTVAVRQTDCPDGVYHF